MRRIAWQLPSTKPYAVAVSAARERGCKRSTLRSTVKQWQRRWTRSIHTSQFPQMCSPLNRLPLCRLMVTCLKQFSNISLEGVGPGVMIAYELSDVAPQSPAEVKHDTIVGPAGSCGCCK